MNTVRMTHPNLPDQPVDVPASAVAHHTRAGWAVEDSAAPTATVAPQSPASAQAVPPTAQPAPTVPMTDTSSKPTTTPDRPRPTTDGTAR